MQVPAAEGGAVNAGLTFAVPLNLRSASAESAVRLSLERLEELRAPEQALGLARVRTAIDRAAARSTVDALLTSRRANVRGSPGSGLPRHSGAASPSIRAWVQARRLASRRLSAAGAAARTARNPRLPSGRRAPGRAPGRKRRGRWGIGCGRPARHPCREVKPVAGSMATVLGIASRIAPAARQLLPAGKRRRPRRHAGLVFEPRDSRSRRG